MGKNKTTINEKVGINVVTMSPDIKLPEYATPLSAGMDVRAFIEGPVTIKPLGRAMIPTGLKMALPAGWECQVRPRSGLAAKHGITVLNTPGTIDARLQ